MTGYDLIFYRLKRNNTQFLKFCQLQVCSWKSCQPGMYKRDHQWDKLPTIHLRNEQNIGCLGYVGDIRGLYYTVKWVL